MHTSPMGSDSKYCCELSMQPQGHHSLRLSRQTSTPSLTVHRNKMHFLAQPTLSASSGHNCATSIQLLRDNRGLLCFLGTCKSPKSCVPTEGRGVVLPGQDLCSSTGPAETHKQHQGSNFTPLRKHSTSHSKGVLMRISA